MAQSLIINALIEKRAEIAGAIAVLERQISQRRADLAHVDATLRMFDPDVQVRAIRAKFPAKPRSSLFGNGEISQRCREAIRDAGGEPISAEAIAVRAMTEKGLDPEDRGCGPISSGGMSGRCPGCSGMARCGGWGVGWARGGVAGVHHLRKRGNVRGRTI